MNLEEHNLREIEGLSQRGKTLSIVDLINANTLNVDMAAYSLYAIANGASFLTAARPGNAGKTTLMACLMTLVPPGEKVITVASPTTVTNAERIIHEEEAERLCFLCHEIGSGHIYGYIWNEYVGQLLHLTGNGCRVASCLHADTLPETRGIMVSRELGVSEEDFNRTGLFLFMNLERTLTGYRRRVATLYESSGEAERHNLLFSWKPELDTFSQQSDPLLLERIAQQRGASTEQVAEELQRCRSFIKRLVESGETDFRWVREEVIRFYSEE